jgi:hypothetical protein
MSETVEDVLAKGGQDTDPAEENFGDWVFLVYRGRFRYTQRNGAACTGDTAHQPQRLPSLR